MYVYICTDTLVYVCMYVYVYKYTYSSPIFVSPIHIHAYTHTCRSPRNGQRKYFGSLRKERESSEKSEAVTRQILSSEFPRGGLPLVYHDEARGILFSAYYTPAATDAYRLLHTYTHTYTHIHTHTYSDVTTVKNVHV